LHCLVCLGKSRALQRGYTPSDFVKVMADHVWDYRANGARVRKLSPPPPQAQHPDWATGLKLKKNRFWRTKLSNRPSNTLETYWSWHKDFRRCSDIFNIHKIYIP
jgi:hypothetical protein